MAWTFFVWTTRIANIWRDEALATGERSAARPWPLSFTLLAIAVAGGPVAAVRTGDGDGRRGARGWSVAVWVVRDARILLADHDVAFIVVHVVLGVVSVVLAALAWREVRRHSVGRPPPRRRSAAELTSSAASTTVSSARVRHRQPPPALRNSSTGLSTTSKPHASSWRPTRGGVLGITIVGPTTTELAQNVSASSSSSHSGSGTSASITLRP